MLADNMRLLNLWIPLEAGFWEIVRVSPPQRVARDERALASVRNVARLTLQVNEVVRSRENFRTLSSLLSLKTTDDQGSMEPSWRRPLQAYDRTLLRFHGQLLAAIRTLEEELEVPDDS